MMGISRTIRAQPILHWRAATIGNDMPESPSNTAHAYKIVLATFGTHGDVHPFIALALALKQRGMAPVIAAAEVISSEDPGRRHCVSSHAPGC